MTSLFFSPCLRFLKDEETLKINNTQILQLDRFLQLISLFLGLNHSRVLYKRQENLQTFVRLSPPIQTSRESSQIPWKSTPMCRIMCFFTNSTETGYAREAFSWEHFVCSDSCRWQIMSTGCTSGTSTKHCPSKSSFSNSPFRQQRFLLE